MVVQWKCAGCGAAYPDRVGNCECATTVVYREDGTKIIHETKPPRAKETKMGKVTESIYSGVVIVPLADVQHIEPWPKNSVPGIMVITKHTKWNFDRDLWENAIWISEPDSTEFRRAWCRYRSELEAETLADLTVTTKQRATSQEDADGESGSL